MALDEASGGGDGGSSADLTGIAAGGGDGGAAPAAAAGGAGGDEGAAAAAAAAAAAGVEPDWYAKLSAEADGDKPGNRDWVKSLGVKDLDGLAKVARDNQAALRDSGRVKVPGEGATDADRAAFHKAIGVPEDPKGYVFEAPTLDDGSQIPLDKPLLDRLAASASKAGVPKAAMEAVVSDFIQAQLDQANDENTAELAAADKAVKAWGSESAAKLAAIDNAAAALGLKKDELLALRKAWGPDRALNIMAKLGEGMAEDTLITGGRGRFGVSVAEAQVEVDKMKATPGMLDKIKVPGSPERMRWDRLQGVLGDHEERKSRAD